MYTNWEKLVKDQRVIDILKAIQLEHTKIKDKYKIKEDIIFYRCHHETN